MNQKLSLDEINAPVGFAAFPIEIGFIGANGPLWLHPHGEVLKLGFRVEMRHCNPMQICHGGMLATFIDMLMPMSIAHQSKMRGRFMPTVQLSQEFLAPAPLGSWVEGTAQVLKLTRNMAFAQCLITADGELCGRASGVFKLGKEIGGAGLSGVIEKIKAANPLPSTEG
jgi:uncharacterized protein (TIGR00369 family)